MAVNFDFDTSGGARLYVDDASEVSSNVSAELCLEEPREGVSVTSGLLVSSEATATAADPRSKAVPVVALETCGTSAGKLAMLVFEVRLDPVLEPV